MVISQEMSISDYYEFEFEQKKLLEIVSSNSEKGKIYFKERLNKTINRLLGCGYGVLETKTNDFLGLPTRILVRGFDSKSKFEEIASKENLPYRYVGVFEMALLREYDKHGE